MRLGLVPVASSGVSAELQRRREGVIGIKIRKQIIPFEAVPRNFFFLLHTIGLRWAAVISPTVYLYLPEPVLRYTLPHYLNCEAVDRASAINHPITEEKKGRPLFR